MGNKQKEILAFCLPSENETGKEYRWTISESESDFVCHSVGIMIKVSKTGMLTNHNTLEPCIDFLNCPDFERETLNHDIFYGLSEQSFCYE